jgi:drug/metabolite transporter (DMT)-like permease
MATIKHKESAQFHSPALGAILAMAGVNVIWGVAFPLTKPALNDIPPFTFACIRFLLALALLLPLAGKSWVEVLRGRDRWRTIILGLCGFGLVQMTQLIALQLSPASDIALIATTTPLWITILAWPMLGERPTARGWAGFGLAIAGLGLIIWPQDTAAGLATSNRWLGDAVYLVGGFLWALYNVVGKDLMTRHGPLAPTAAACLVGTLSLAPLSLWEITSGQPVRFTLLAIFALLFVAFLVTVLGFLTLFWAYRRANAAQVAITMYLQPLAGVLVAWLWLGEALSAGFLVGAALVLAGVGLVSLTRGQGESVPR